MIQRRITQPTRLLDDNGNVAVPGWCEQNRYIYSRKDIKAGAGRIKEWNFYQISNERYTVQMTFADISLAGACSFTLMDRETGNRIDSAIPSLLTFGRFGMPETAEGPYEISKKLPYAEMSERVTKKARYLSFEGMSLEGKVKADLEIAIPEGLESLTMAVPFSEDKHFYLNQKINCMPVKGYITCGKQLIEFSEDDTFAVLDWGRGVWPYAGDWYWGNGSKRLPDGKVFGFEIGWGFGIMEEFTENTLFYDFKAHKIGRISLEYDENNVMNPWIFSSDDGRFEMTMTPTYDNFTQSRVAGLVGNICHQVYGKFNGYVVLDDGTKLEIKDMLAFCEHSDNRW